MNRLLFYLARLTRVAAGFLLALAAASAIVLVADLNKGRLPEWLAGAVALGLVTFQAAGWLWPLVLLGFLSEVFAWRALALYAAAGLASAGAALAFSVYQAGGEAPDPLLGEEPAFTLMRLAIFLVAGLAGGIVYWLVAGRTAGIGEPARTQP